MKIFTREFWKSVFGSLKGKKSEPKPWPLVEAPKVQLKVNRVFQSRGGNMIEIKAGTYQLVKITLGEVKWLTIEGKEAAATEAYWKALYNNGLVVVL